MLIISINGELNSEFYYFLNIVIYYASKQVAQKNRLYGEHNRYFGGREGGSNFGHRTL